MNDVLNVNNPRLRIPGKQYTRSAAALRSGRYFIYDSYSVPIYRFLYCTLSSSSVLDCLGTWLTFVS